MSRSSPSRATKARTAKPVSLLLRGLDPEVLAVLRDRAARAGRSLQSELQLSLRRDAHRNFDEARAISCAWHAKLKGRRFPAGGSAAFLREDRGR